jgi:hypothetical protein
VTTERDSSQLISDQLVRLIQVFFAVLLVQGIVRNDELVTSPLGAAHQVAFVGFIGFYVATIRSWIDWHITMNAYPYKLNRLSGHRTTELARVWTDISFVVMYAYLIFTLEPAIRSPNLDLSRHFIGYPIVFALYWISGALRRRTYGVQAGQLRAIALFGVPYLLLVVVYWLVASVWDHKLLPGERGWLNAAMFVLFFVLTVTYRSYRETLRNRDIRAQRKQDSA